MQSDFGADIFDDDPPTEQPERSARRSAKPRAQAVEIRVKKTAPRRDAEDLADIEFGQPSPRPDAAADSDTADADKAAAPDTGSRRPPRRPRAERGERGDAPATTATPVEPRARRQRSTGVGEPRPRRDRPRGDRDRGDRDRGERDRGERDRGDRDRGERPRGGRDRGDRHRGERRDRDRPEDDRGRRRGRDRERGRGDRPAGPRGGHTKTSETTDTAPIDRLPTRGGRGRQTQPTTASARVALLLDLEDLSRGAREHGWEISYRRLQNRLVADRTAVRVLAYAPDDQPELGAPLAAARIELQTCDPDAIEVALSVDAMTIAPRVDCVVVGSDSAAFAPLVAMLRSQGIRVESASFSPKSPLDSQFHHEIDKSACFAP